MQLLSPTMCSSTVTVRPVVLPPNFRGGCLGHLTRRWLVTLLVNKLKLVLVRQRLNPQLAEIAEVLALADLPLLLPPQCSRSRLGKGTLSKLSHAFDL